MLRKEDLKIGMEIIFEYKSNRSTIYGILDEIINTDDKQNKYIIRVIKCDESFWTGVKIRNNKKFLFNDADLYFAYNYIDYIAKII